MVCVLDFSRNTKNDSNKILPKGCLSSVILNTLTVYMLAEKPRDFGC